MSHDLDHSSGKAAMAYVGQKPWHGLGEKLEPGRPLDEWISAAKLGWQIQMLPVCYHFEGIDRTMADRFVLARDDTGTALSVVSADYQVVQPREVLEFYRDLVEERQYTLETAGALDGGRKVWALAKTGLVANVAGNAKDSLGAYVLLATSCDKSIATTATFTSIRVVCQNTLAFAFADVKKNARRHVKVNHSKKFDPSAMKEELGLVDAAWTQFLNQIETLAAHRMSGEAAQAYFEGLFISDKALKEGKPLSASKSKEINQLLSLYRSGKGQDLETARDTLWGALNAATNYVDHVRSTGSGERIDSAWFGVGAALKQRAWFRALDLVAGAGG